MKKILITGGAGFIGSNLADLYIKNGYEVIIIDNISSGSLDNIPKHVKFYEIDICNPEFIDIVLNEKPDIINHHAAQIDIQFSIQNPIQDANTNIIGTINVLESIRQLKEFKECILIYASSAAVYGEPKYLGIDENHVTNPLSFYGASKLTPELYIQIYHDLYQIPYTIFRYANVYGIGQDPRGEGGVISILIDRIINNSVFTVYGDGEQTRDYIFVEDVVNANLLASENPVNNICNLSTNTQTSLNQLLKIADEIVNKKIEVIYEDERSGDIKHSYLVNEKVYTLLNWKPVNTLAEGLEKTINYYLDSTKL